MADKPVFLYAAVYDEIADAEADYGDFSPTTAGTQIFTIVYILTGFGVLVALLTSVAQQYLKHQTEPRPARARRRARRQRDRPTEEEPTPPETGGVHGSSSGTDITQTKPT
jgi:hypothetical protein